MTTGGVGICEKASFLTSLLISIFLQEVPKFPKINDLSDLTDGVALTSIMSLYCPDDLPWSNLALGDPPSMADSLYNIQLLHRFCKDILPFNVCHLTIEDVVYLHESIRQNVLCFLADLFVGLEVKPVIKSVQLPGVKKDRIIDIPDPDLHRKTSPTGLKRLNAAVESSQRAGKFFYPFLTFTGMSGQKFFFS